MMSESDEDPVTCGYRAMCFRLCECCCHAPDRRSILAPVSDITVGRIEVLQADITDLDVTAIVNAARPSLVGGGGVDGAIHRAAGPKLRRACAALGGCEPGQAKITDAYNLRCRYVIHTVGPVGEQPDVLSSCYQQCMKLAAEHNISSLAFPCISTGSYGYPAEAAARVAVSTVRQEVLKYPEIESIIFTVFSKTQLDIYTKLLSSKDV